MNATSDLPSNVINTTTGPLDEKVLVQQLNDDMARLMVPATVYIVLLMVSGLVGNVMVVYYYTFKSKFSTNSFFIVNLAVYDLVVCSICMPTEIADIELFYTFDNDAACKVLRFLNYLAGVGSILTLLAIGVDRFRKIYKRTGRQMTMKEARITSVAVFVAALFLSWLSLIIYGAIRVPIPNDMGYDLKGSDCTSTKDRAYRGYVWAFNLVHFGMFLICSVVLIALYSIIGHTIYQHGKKLARHSTYVRDISKSSPKESSSDPSSSTSVKDEGVACKTSEVDLELKHVNGKVKAEHGSVTELKQKKSAKRSQAQNIKTGLDNETVRITVVMIAVTVLFIVSFLPYLSLTVWRVAKGQHEAEFLSGAGLVAFKIGSRSFLLNSSLNPWIYGIFNSAFRNFYFNRCKCK